MQFACPRRPAPSTRSPPTRETFRRLFLAVSYHMLSDAESGRSIDSFVPRVMGRSLELTGCYEAGFRPIRGSPSIQIFAWRGALARRSKALYNARGWVVSPDVVQGQSSLRFSRPSVVGKCHSSDHQINAYCLHNRNCNRPMSDTETLKTASFLGKGGVGKTTSTAYLARSLADFRELQ